MLVEYRLKRVAVSIEDSFLKYFVFQKMQCRPRGEISRNLRLRLSSTAHCPFAKKSVVKVGYLSKPTYAVNRLLRAYALRNHISPSREPPAQKFRLVNVSNISSFSHFILQVATSTSINLPPGTASHNRPIAQHHPADSSSPRLSRRRKASPVNHAGLCKPP